VAVVDVPAMADCFDAQQIGVAIPGDDRAVVADAEFVVGVAGESVEAVLGPVRRFVDFVEDALGDVGFEVLQVFGACSVYSASVIEPQPFADLGRRQRLVVLGLLATLRECLKRGFVETRGGIHPIPKRVPNRLRLARIPPTLPLLVDRLEQRLRNANVDLLHPLVARIRISAHNL
jgi:hypothetical protein